MFDKNFEATVDAIIYIAIAIIIGMCASNLALEFASCSFLYGMTIFAGGALASYVALVARVTFESDYIEEEIY